MSALGTALDATELGQVLAARGVAPRKKQAIIEAVLASAGEVSGEVRRLVGALAGKDRLALLSDVVAAFDDKSRESGRVVPAEIVTAMPLPSGAKDKLASALAHAVGRDVTLSERVDPSIIGGVVARVGSLVFDGSMTRQIQRLREKLIAGA
jgi:F-type H+-transporting ATPase subunit delta